MSYYNGKKVLSVIRNAANGIEGITYTDNVLTVNCYDFQPEQINVVGAASIINLAVVDTELDISNAIGAINITDTNSNQHTVSATNLKAENIAKGVTILGVTGTHENGITGVTWADSELTVDCEALQPHEIYIERAGKSPSININGDTTTVNLELVDGTVDISNCTSEIEIVDNRTQQHSVAVNNLAPSNIAKGVTILGVTGTHESGTPIEVATATEMDALLVADNVNKIYKYVGTTDATYEYGELYQVVEE